MSTLSHRHVEPGEVLSAVALGGLGGVLLVVNDPWSVLLVGVLLGSVLVARLSFNGLLLLAGIGVIFSAMQPANYPYLLALHNAAYGGKFVLYGLLILASVVGARLASNRRRRMFVAALLAPALFAFVSATWTSALGLTLARVLAFLLLLGFVGTAVLFRWRKEAEITDQVRVLAGLGGVTLLLCLPLFIAGTDYAFNPDVFGLFGQGRFQGFLQNPNTIGMLAGVSLPLMIVFALQREDKRRWFWRALVLISLFALGLSLSRGGFLAAGFGVAAMFLRRAAAPWRTRLLMVGATLWIGVVAAAVMGPALLQRTQAIGADAGRFAAWEIATGLASTRPFTGWGFGTAEQVFGERALAIDTSECGAYCFQGANVHNGYLQALVEVGPIGTLLLLAPIIVAFHAGATGVASDVKAGLFGTLVAGISVSLVESGLTAAGSILALYFWFSAGALVAYRETEKRLV